MRRYRALVLLALCAVAVPAPCSAAESYSKAFIDQTGQLHILTTDGRDITPPKQPAPVGWPSPDQEGFDQVAISPDQHSVGWLAVYGNCCTSYLLPLKLLVYTDGRLHTFTGSGVPIFKWVFRAGGKQVAFHQEPAHFGIPHYELRDVATGRLVASHDGTVNRFNQALPTESFETWVEELNGHPPPPGPFRLSAECDRASELNFLFTLKNVSTMPSVAVLGSHVGDHYLIALTMTLRRRGVPNRTLDFNDPAFTIAGQIDPWFIILPVGASYSVTVPAAYFELPTFEHEKFSVPSTVQLDLITMPADRRVLLAAPGIREWVGTLTSEWLRVPRDCDR